MKKLIIIIIAIVVAYNVFLKEELCQRCGYSGLINCSECNGVGLEFPNGYSAPSKRCDECGGRALEECSDCNGDGRTSLFEECFR